MQRVGRLVQISRCSFYALVTHELVCSGTISIMSHQPIVFVDVETTGLSARDGHILEIGVVRVQDNKIVATYNKLLHPGVEVPWFITNLTGITNNDVSSSPQFAQVADELEQLFEGAVFAAHNVSFDYGFFSEEYRRLGHKINMDRFCTAKLSRTLHPQHKGHSLDKIILRGGYSVTNRHRAYDDAYVLYQFYQDALKQHGQKLLSTVQKITVPADTAVAKQAITYVPYNE